TWPNRSSWGRASESTWLRSIPERIASTVTTTSFQNPPGSLTPMPDDERTPDRDDDHAPVFTGFGIGSAVLGVLAVAAVALAVLIWTQHRSDVDELHYRT